MSTSMSSSKRKKEDTALREVFWSFVDRRYVVYPLQELGIKTVHDVITRYNNKQNWQAVEKKFKESAENEAALTKITTMIQYFQAGPDSFEKWVQERREQERRQELQMTLYHNQHYYLMEMLGLDEIYAHLIGSRFGKFNISDLSELANQKIS